MVKIEVSFVELLTQSVVSRGSLALFGTEKSSIVFIIQIPPGSLAQNRDLTGKILIFLGEGGAPKSWTSEELQSSWEQFAQMLGKTTEEL